MTETNHNSLGTGGRPDSPPPYVPQHIYSREDFLLVRTAAADTAVSLAPSLPVASPRAKERWTLRLVHNDWGAAAALPSSGSHLERTGRAARPEASGRRQRRSAPGAPGAATSEHAVVPVQLPELVPVSEDWLKPHPLLDLTQDIPLEETGKETKDGDEFVDGFLEHARKGEDLLVLDFEAQDQSQGSSLLPSVQPGKPRSTIGARSAPDDAELIAPLHDMRLSGTVSGFSVDTAEPPKHHAQFADSETPGGKTGPWAGSQRPVAQSWHAAPSIGTATNVSNQRETFAGKPPAETTPANPHPASFGDIGMLESRLGRWTHRQADVAPTGPGDRSAQEYIPDRGAPVAGGATRREQDPRAETLSPSVLAFFNQVRAQAAVSNPPSRVMETTSDQQYAAVTTHPRPESGTRFPADADPSLYALFGRYPVPPLSQLGPPPGFGFPPHLEQSGVMDMQSNFEQQRQRPQHVARGLHIPQPQPQPQPQQPPQAQLPTLNVPYQEAFPVRGGPPSGSTLGALVPNSELDPSRTGHIPQPVFIQTSSWISGPAQNGPFGPLDTFPNGPVPFDAQAPYAQSTDPANRHFRDQKWPPNLSYQP